MWKRKGNSLRFMDKNIRGAKRNPLMWLGILLAIMALLLLGLALLYGAPLRFTLVPQETTEDLDAELVIAKRLPFLSDVRYMGYSSTDAKTMEPAHILWYEAKLPPFLTLGSDACALCLARFDTLSGRLEKIHVFIGNPGALERAVQRYDVSFQKAE